MDPKKAPVEALRAVIAETQSAQFDLMMMIDRLEARPGGAETDIDATRQSEAGLHKLYVRLGRILFRGEEGIPTSDENGMLDAPINEVIDGDSSARSAVIARIFKRQSASRTMVRAPHPWHGRKK